MIHSASQNNCVIDQIRHLKPDLVQPAVKFDWFFVISCGCRQGRFNLFGSVGTLLKSRYERLHIILIWQMKGQYFIVLRKLFVAGWVVCHHSCQLVSITSPQLLLTTFQFLSTCEYYVTTAVTDHIPVPLNLWVLHHHSSHWPHSSSSQLVSNTSPHLSLTTFQFLSTCEYYVTTALTDNSVPFRLWVLHHHSSHWPHSSSSQL